MMSVSLYAAILAVALVALSVRVIRLRRRYEISLGHENNSQLERAIRVHANFTEYAPFFLIMLALAEIQGMQPAYVHGFGTCFLAARTAHFVGLRSPDAPGIYRVLGMALTFAAIGLVSVILLLQYLDSLIS